jgi:hypothetical protein
MCCVECLGSIGRRLWSDGGGDCLTRLDLWNDGGFERIGNTQGESMGLRANRRSFDCAPRDETARASAQDDNFYFLQLFKFRLYVDIRQCLVFGIRDLLATPGIIADPERQQIPIRLRSGHALHSAALRSG